MFASTANASKTKNDASGTIFLYDGANTHAQTMKTNPDSELEMQFNISSNPG
jgi:hypothetical protein